MKKVVLISSGQPSVNPRLVKEANAISASGYEVYVIYSFWTSWAWETDKELFKNMPWKPILVGGSPFQNGLLYFFTRLRFKMAVILAEKFTFQFGIAELAKGRTYKEMLQKAYSIKADLYIAHNLSALPVAVKAAKKYAVKCGFDAEDFHRQEVSDNADSFNYKISQYLEDKYLPVTDYITAASPLIASAYKKLYPQLRPIVINNVFELKLQPSIVFNDTKKLKLFWFSQTIGKGRGIENVIAALNILKNNHIELHLLGALNAVTEQYFKKLASEAETILIFHEPVSSERIFGFAARFDIGMATELNTPLNRDICLTNKIFTYLLSGLAIIASETSAQKQFVELHQSIGKSYPAENTGSLAKIIAFYFSHKDELNRAKLAAYELGKSEFNWEKESDKLLKIIKSLI